MQLLWPAWEHCPSTASFQVKCSASLIAAACAWQQEHAQLLPSHLIFSGHHSAFFGQSGCTSLLCLLPSEPFLCCSILAVGTLCISISITMLLFTFIQIQRGSHLISLQQLLVQPSLDNVLKFHGQTHLIHSVTIHLLTAPFVYPRITNRSLLNSQ